MNAYLLTFIIVGVVILGIALATYLMPSIHQGDRVPYNSSSKMCVAPPYCPMLHQFYTDNYCVAVRDCR